MSTPVLVTLALAGGQGKTTTALMLGRYLGRCGIPVLFVDCDPQASLTSFSGVEVQATQPTMYEILTTLESKVAIADCIVPIEMGEIERGGEKIVLDNSNLFIIPADSGLDSANYKLAAGGMSLRALRKRLEKIKKDFGIIIVDSPPERLHLTQAALGAGDYWVIPAEANIKGVQSLARTLELIEEYESDCEGEFLGAIPFRSQWVGKNPTNITKSSIEAMEEFAPGRVLPYILESDGYKRAINFQCLPRDFGKAELEHPIEELARKLKPKLAVKYQGLL
jgi:chromosome partitioning protein